MSANKRMFSKDVVESDGFLDLPYNSQLLYFHLGINGDLRGFVEPKKVIRMIGLKPEDLRPLVENGFVLIFESGVIVITHWSVNNNLREDREAETRFLEEFEKLACSNDKYQLLENSRSTPAQLPPRIGEVRIGEVRIDKERGDAPKESSKEYLIEIKDNPEEIAELTDKFNCTKGQLIGKALDFHGYCVAKGKAYKNYKAALSNALSKDFGRRTPKKEEVPMVELSPEEQARNIEQMAKLRSKVIKEF